MTALRTPWLNRSCACGLANDAHDDADYDEHGDCKRATGLGAQLAAAETTLEQTQALLSRREADVERLTQEVRRVTAERDEVAAENERCHAKLDREQGLDDGGVTVAADTLEDRLNVFVKDCANALADACSEAHDALAELATLRNLAERANRSESYEERLIAASLVCARLVRPNDRFGDDVPWSEERQAQHERERAEMDCGRETE